MAVESVVEAVDQANGWRPRAHDGHTVVGPWSPRSFPRLADGLVSSTCGWPWQSPSGRSSRHPGRLAVRDRMHASRGHRGLAAIVCCEHRGLAERGVLNGGQGLAQTVPLPPSGSGTVPPPAWLARATALAANASGVVGARAVSNLKRSSLSVHCRRERKRRCRSSVIARTPVGG